jgi:hypothetical protein
MSCFGSRNRLTLVYRLDRKQRAETMTRAGFAAVRGSAVSSNVAEFRTGKSALSDAHVLGMATIVQCNCGAEYRRTEEKFLVPHTGDAVCTVCGAALESWLESTHVPKYELVERPGKPE